MDDVKLPSYVTTVLAIIGSALGGYLLKTGLVTADQLPALGGAALVVIAVVWRVISKAQQRAALKSAIAAPAGLAK